MKISRQFLFLIAAGILLTPTVLAERTEFRWNGDLGAGQTLSVKGINGHIDAELAQGAEAEVVAYKEGRRSDPESVEIAVVEHAEGVTLCAIYPTRRGKGYNECLPFGRGGSNNEDNDVTVDFVVRVPSGVDFIAKTVNGDVEIAGLEGDVRGHTVNGGVRISTSGWAEASTVNGSIRASMGAADWEGRLEFETVNGSITLEFPDSLSTEVRAESLNGGIHSDFDMDVTSRSKRSWGKQRLRGRIGALKSDRELKLETVNGAITLRRSGF